MKFSSSCLSIISIIRIKTGGSHSRYSSSSVCRYSVDANFDSNLTEIKSPYLRSPNRLPPCPGLTSPRVSVPNILRVSAATALAGARRVSGVGVVRLRLIQRRVFATLSLHDNLVMPVMFTLKIQVLGRGIER